jgi:hypothetical protein
MPKTEARPHTETPFSPEIINNFCINIDTLRVDLLKHQTDGTSNSDLIPPLHDMLGDLLYSLPNMRPEIAESLLRFDQTWELTLDLTPNVVQLRAKKNTPLGSLNARLRISAKSNQNPELSQISITCRTSNGPNGDKLEDHSGAVDGTNDYIEVGINQKQKGKVVVFRSIKTHESNSLGDEFLVVERIENPDDKDKVTDLLKSLFSEYLIYGSVSQLPRFSLIKVHLPNQSTPIFIATTNPYLVGCLEFSHTSDRLIITNPGEFKNKSVSTTVHFKGDLIDEIWHTNSQGKNHNGGDILLKDPDNILRINSLTSGLFVNEYPQDCRVIMYDFSGVFQQDSTLPVSAINAAV